MPSANTEKLHDKAPGLDLQPPEAIAKILVEGQIAAARAVLPATSALTAGAQAMAAALSGGGRLFYVAAGSSGLMAAADALELGGTFGIAHDRVRIVMAGGLPTDAAMPGDTEDASDTLAAELDDLTAADTMIAVAASGSTPFTLAAMRIARDRGARIVGLANNAASPLLELADVPVLLETPPEVISGSTRMGAATAQKIALNAMSTLMATALGHIYDGMMVGVVADNGKLRARACRIVSTATGTDEATASAALAAARGDVKMAILIVAGAGSLAAAQKTLDENEGHLRQALERLRYF